MLSKKVLTIISELFLLSREMAETSSMRSAFVILGLLSVPVFL